MRVLGNRKKRKKRKKTTIIDFPKDIQTTSYTCGCSVVKNVLTFCGRKELTEIELKSLLGATPKGGVDPISIINFLKKRKIDIKYGELTIDKLKRYLKSGYPVILAVQAWADKRKIDYEEAQDDGHYLVAIGLNNGGFIFEDPSIKSDSRGIMNFEDLKKRWHDVDKFGNEYNNFGIVIKCKTGYKAKKQVKIEWFLKTVQIK